MTADLLSPGQVLSKRLDPRTGAVLCRGTSKRSGEPCRAAAVAGTDLCHTHAGVTLEAQRAKGEAALMLAQVAAETPRSHPGEVLLKAGHAAHVLLDRCLAVTPAGAPEVAQLELLVSAIDRAARIAKAALDADAQDRWVRAQESVASRDWDAIKALLTGVLAAVDVAYDDPRVQAAVRAELEKGEGK